jgi:hypothetical protein
MQNKNHTLDVLLDLLFFAAKLWRIVSFSPSTLLLAFHAFLLCCCVPNKFIEQKAG